MSITTKIIAPIWLIGMLLAGLAIFIERSTLAPRFSEHAAQSTEALVRAVGAVAATSSDTPGAVDRAVSILGEDDYVRLIVVVMGAEDTRERTRNSIDLLEYGFNFYETHKLYSAGKVLRESRIWKGDDSILQLGLTQDLYVTIPRGEYLNLQPSMMVKKSIFAPVDEHQELGQIMVDLHDETIQQQPLVALHEVSRGNLLRRMVDHVLYLVK